VTFAVGVNCRVNHPSLSVFLSFFFLFFFYCHHQESIFAMRVFLFRCSQRNRRVCYLRRLLSLPRRSIAKKRETHVVKGGPMRVRSYVRSLSDVTFKTSCFARTRATRCSSSNRIVIYFMNESHYHRRFKSAAYVRAQRSNYSRGAFFDRIAFRRDVKKYYANETPLRFNIRRSFGCVIVNYECTASNERNARSRDHFYPRVYLARSLASVICR